MTLAEFWQAPTTWPIWAVVVACGISGQILKTVVYGLVNRHAAFSYLAQGHGIPSLQATVLSCLLVQTVVRPEAGPSHTAFALVFAVIVVHDTVKLRLMASRQREELVRLVHVMPGTGDFRQKAAEFLDPRTHHPIHVAVGLAWGGLFALAFTMTPG